MYNLSHNLFVFFELLKTLHKFQKFLFFYKIKIKTKLNLLLETEKIIEFSDSSAYSEKTIKYLKLLKFLNNNFRYFLF